MIGLVTNAGGVLFPIPVVRFKRRDSETMIDIPSVLVAAAVGVGGSLLSWWRASAVAETKHESEILRLRESSDAELGRLDERDDGLRCDFRQLRDEFRDGIQDMRTVAGEMGKLQASQNVVNSVTAKAIEGLTDKLEEHSRQLSDHAATLRLINELVTRKDRNQ